MEPDTAAAVCGVGLEVTLPRLKRCAAGWAAAARLSGALQTELAAALGAEAAHLHSTISWQLASGYVPCNLSLGISVP